MNDRTRVLFVGAFPPVGSPVYGGAVTACRALLASEFAREFDLILVDSTQARNPLPGFLVRAGYAVRRFFRYVHRFESRRPNVVLMFTSAGTSVLEKGAMAWYARARGTPAILFPRGGKLMEDCERSPVRRAAVRILFSGAARIFCQGGQWRDFVRSTLALPDEKAVVIPNWTATADLLAIGQNRVHVGKDLVRLVFVGWVERNKGVEDLLRACAAATPEHEFELEVIGGGHFFTDAQALAIELGIGARVRFRGGLPPDQVTAALWRADVFVLPSWAEGLPNAMIEAMAAGLAVIVSDVGNISDFVVADTHALVVPPRDVEALSAALVRMIDDVGLRRRISTAGHGLAAGAFGIDNAVSKMTKEIRGLHEQD